MKQEEKKNFMEWAFKEIQEYIKAKKVIPDDEELNPFWKAYGLLDEYLATIDEDGKSKAFEIFSTFLKGLPLAPLENREEDWVEAEDPGVYRHKRRFTLYKMIINGEERFADTARIICINSEDNKPYSFQFGARIIDRFYPITFPYTPNERPIRLYTVDFTFENIRYVGLSTVLFPDKPAASLRICFKMDENENITEISHNEFLSAYTKYDEMSKQEEENA